MISRKQSTRKLLQPEILEKCRQYAFLLLKFRLRSESEMLQRLVKKGFTPEVAESTVAFLKERRFLDDRQFARAWINSRLKRPFGFRRIKQELNAKGISEDKTRDLIEEIKNGYCEEDVVNNIAQQRFSKLKGIEPEKAKKRIYSYLLRRGFSPEVIIEAIKIHES